MRQSARRYRESAGFMPDADLRFPLQQLGQGRKTAAQALAIERRMGLGHGQHQLVALRRRAGVSSMMPGRPIDSMWAARIAAPMMRARL